MTLEANLIAFRNPCLWPVFQGDYECDFSCCDCEISCERKNNNKDVFLFGYSVGNDYLCRDFSAKAIKDFFHHSIV
ncbi:hypothetical protein HMPREF1254_1843 [Prevotella sp. BV3P1]|nr:hypothetical protein HMPREF1254_1843 [Prevotella sp. BV3P1]